MRNLGTPPENIYQPCPRPRNSRENRFEGAPKGSPACFRPALGCTHHLFQIMLHRKKYSSLNLVRYLPPKTFRQYILIIFVSWLDSPSRPRPPPSRGSAITLTHNTLGTTSLDKTLARRRRLYPYNTQRSRQTSMPPAGFEPTIPASERAQTHAVDRAATWIGLLIYDIYDMIYI